MSTSRSLYFVLLAAIIGIGCCSSPCPGPEAIYPCVCSSYVPDSVLLYCSNLSSQSQIRLTLDSISLPHIAQLKISLSNLGPLLPETLGNKTFSVLAFSSNTNFSIPNPTIYHHAAENLTDFTLSDNEIPINVLNWEDVQVLNSVTNLFLSRNGIEMLNLGSSTSEKMQKLRILSLAGNKLRQVPVFPKISNLFQLELQSNAIEQIEAGTFANLERLGRLILSGNQISELAPGTISTPVTLDRLDLSYNEITTIAAGAISGPLPNAVVDLNKNNLSELREDVFRPLVGGFISGHLTIKGNPLDCSCSLKWLITNSTLLERVRNGACSNGTVLEELDPSYYETQC